MAQATEDGAQMNLYGLVKDKRQDILQAAAMHGATNVRIFGSVAKGEANEDSDIDVLVDLDPGRSLFDLGGLHGPARHTRPSCPSSHGERYTLVYQR